MKVYLKITFFSSHTWQEFYLLQAAPKLADRDGVHKNSNNHLNNVEVVVLVVVVVVVEVSIIKLSKFLAPMIQNFLIGNYQTSWSSYCILSHCFKPQNWRFHFTVGPEIKPRNVGVTYIHHQNKVNHKHAQDWFILYILMCILNRTLAVDLENISRIRHFCLFRFHTSPKWQKIMWKYHFFFTSLKLENKMLF